MTKRIPVGLTNLKIITIRNNVAVVFFFDVGQRELGHDRLFRLLQNLDFLQKSFGLAFVLQLLFGRPFLLAQLLDVAEKEPV